MRKCKKCKIEILDDTIVCPLCKSVLEEKEDVDCVGYPNAKAASRKLNIVINLYSVLAVVTEIILIIINYATYHGIWWCAISGITILYFFVTLKYSLQKNSSYKTVILVQVIGAVLLGIGVDNIVGYRGWSMNYVVPGAIILLDATIVVLMIINIANWQSYILMQILNVIISIAGLILWFTGIIDRPFLIFLAAGSSGFLLLATI
ncbi:MAG: DUF6320 domain-containing protein, partial [Lachnospiraceae bacterium]